MHGGRNPGRRARGATPSMMLGALGAMLIMLVLAAPAAAQRFPAPHCGWVKPSLVDRTFGLQVTKRKPRWTIKVAPILNCNYVEQHAKLQVAGKPIVNIQFREIQRLKLSPGFVPIAGLGSCRVRVSCPKGQRHAAWIYTVNGATSLNLSFTSGLVLSVEDGLNNISIEVVNPFGPVPVANERAAAIRLAKRLLPRFRYK